MRFHLWIFYSLCISLGSFQALGATYYSGINGPGCDLVNNTSSIMTVYIYNASGGYATAVEVQPNSTYAQVQFSQYLARPLRLDWRLNSTVKQSDYLDYQQGAEAYPDIVYSGNDAITNGYAAWSGTWTNNTGKYALVDAFLYSSNAPTVIAGDFLQGEEEPHGSYLAAPGEVINFGATNGFGGRMWLGDLRSGQGVDLWPTWNPINNPPPSGGSTSTPTFVEPFPLISGTGAGGGTNPATGANVYQLGNAIVRSGAGVELGLFRLSQQLSNQNNTGMAQLDLSNAIHNLDQANRASNSVMIGQSERDWTNHQAMASAMTNQTGLEHQGATNSGFYGAVSDAVGTNFSIGGRAMHGAIQSHVGAISALAPGAPIAMGIINLGSYGKWDLKEVLKGNTLADPYAGHDLYATGVSRMLLGQAGFTMFTKKFLTWALYFLTLYLFVTLMMKSMMDVLYIPHVTVFPSTVKGSSVAGTVMLKKMGLATLMTGMIILMPSMVYAMWSTGLETLIPSMANPGGSFLSWVISAIETVLYPTSGIVEAVSSYSWMAFIWALLDTWLPIKAIFVYTFNYLAGYIAVRVVTSTVAFGFKLMGA